jgi:hypothetical protein
VISGGQTGVDRAALDAAIAVPAPEQTWTSLFRWSTLMEREVCR